MKTIKRHLYRLYILPLCFCLTAFLLGCGGYQTRNYAEPELGEDKISTITTDDQFITIAAVNGQKSLDTSNPKNVMNAILWGRNPRTVHVLPGKHQILPCMENPYEHVCAESWLTIETEPGKTYVIRHERRDDKRIGFWSEEQKKDNKE
jgi:hypothetical protein